MQNPPIDIIEQSQAFPGLDNVKLAGIIGPSAAAAAEGMKSNMVQDVRVTPANPQTYNRRKTVHRRLTSSKQSKHAAAVADPSKDYLHLKERLAVNRNITQSVLRHGRKHKIVQNFGT